MKIKKKKTVTEQISCDVIKVFKSDTYDQYNRVELRVVKWSSGKIPVFEKRRVWNLKDGKLVHRQIVGMNSADIDFIVANSEEIKKALSVSNVDFKKEEV